MRGRTDNLTIPDVPEIGLVLYPQAQAAAIEGLTDLFVIADRLERSRLGTLMPALRVTHYALDGTRVFDSLPSAAGHPRVLVLPPSLADPLSFGDAPPLSAWLRGHHEVGTWLAGVCTGVFLLAATGVLSGRHVTAHGMYADELARRYPGIHVTPNRSLLDDGDVLSSAGLMSWTDVGLRLVERILGTGAMLDTAGFMQVDPPGGDKRAVDGFQPDFTHGDAAVLKVQHRLHRAGTRGVTIAGMATEAGLGERTFLRRFHKATGLKPTEYCQHVRVSQACEMLATTNWPIDRIAWQVGYDDAGSFRKIFVRVTGSAPGDYRRRVRNEASAA